MKLYRTYGAIGGWRADVTWVTPTPVLFRLYKAFLELIAIWIVGYIIFCE